MLYPLLELPGGQQIVKGLPNFLNPLIPLWLSPDTGYLTSMIPPN